MRACRVGWLALLAVLLASRPSQAEDAPADFRLAVLRGGFAGAPALSPDGRFVANSGNAWDSGSVWALYRTDGSNEVRPLDAAGFGRSQPAPVFSPDGSMLAILSPGRLRVWDVSTGKVRLVPFEREREFNGDADRLAGVVACFFSPDSKTVTSVNQKGDLMEIAIETGEMHAARIRPPAGAVRATPDGRLLVDCGQGDVPLEVIELQTGKRRMSVVRPRGLCAISPDGETLSIGNELWGTRSGRPRVRLADAHTVGSAVFSPDGRWFVTGGDDGRVMVWDVAMGMRKVALRLGGGAVYGLAIDAGGRVLAAEVQRGAVHLLDLPRLLAAAPMDDALAVLSTAPGRARTLDVASFGSYWGILLASTGTSPGNSTPRDRTAPLLRAKELAASLRVALEEPKPVDFDASTSVDVAGAPQIDAIAKAYGAQMGTLFRLMAYLSVWRWRGELDGALGSGAPGPIWARARERLKELAASLSIPSEAIAPLRSTLDERSSPGDRANAIWLLTEELQAHFARLERGAGPAPGPARFARIAAIPMALEAFELGQVWVQEVIDTPGGPADPAFPHARAIAAVVGVRIPSPPERAPDGVDARLAAFESVREQLLGAHGAGVAATFRLGAILRRVERAYVPDDSQLAGDLTRTVSEVAPVLGLTPDAFEELVRDLKARASTDVVRRAGARVTADLRAALEDRPLSK